MSTARPIPADVSILTIFFLHAFSGGGLFARVPDLQAQSGLGEAALGLAFTGAAAGGLVVVPLARRLVAALGTPAPILLSTVAMALANVAAALAGGFAGLASALIAGGVAFSVGNVAINVEADRVEAALSRRIMNRCHGFWGIGFLAASGLGVAARALPVSALGHFLVVLPLVLAACAVLWRGWVQVPARRAADDQPTGFALPDGDTVRLTLFGLSAGAAQGAVQSWSVIYMEQGFAAPDWVEATTLPIYTAFLTLGRLAADGWVTRLGAVAVARAMAGLALLGGLAVVLAPWLWLALIGFALMGIGTAAIFPLAISAAARVDHRPAEDSVAAMILAMGAVLLVVPAVMGWVADVAGLRVALALLIPFFLLTLALADRAGD